MLSTFEILNFEKDGNFEEDGNFVEDRNFDLVKNLK